MTRGYWGTILSVDDSVGQLYQLLSERKQLDNTIIVFLADNGILNGEHGMVDKRTMHEPSIRIPLLVRYPKLVATATPKVIEQQVLTLDIAPSLLELCQAPALKEIAGRSWVKLVQSGDPAWRKSWLYHYNYEQQFPYTPNVRGVRTRVGSIFITHTAMVNQIVTWPSCITWSLILMNDGILSTIQSTPDCQGITS